ncbi:MAG TPA: HD domain-containing protein, partial [Gammaproteobacteria bacterium]|nr:HD domain-containing protein [Gammaproteobacteria bacterium]
MVSTTRQAPKQTLGDRWEAACELAAHRNEISEPLPDGMQVVDVLQQLNVDESSLIAALLADRRCADISPEVIAAKLGNDVASLVKNVRLLNNFRPCREDHPGLPEQAERLRRLLLAITNDVRAVLVKLAYRLAHLRLLDQESDAQRRCLAQETIDIFAPLANRLGVA